MKKQIKAQLVEKPVAWESPNFVKDFWFHIMDGIPLMRSPKHKKVNLLK